MTASHTDIILRVTTGIHHITAFASEARKNVDFYTRILGLRLVKKTVNQDDVGTYHLFYGDRLGHPGMDLTFFVFQPAMPGKRGSGQVATISLAVPAGSLGFWRGRFEKTSVNHDAAVDYFGQKQIVFYDDDGHQLALVFVPGLAGTSPDLWTTHDVSQDHAIRYFHSATLAVANRMTIEPVLTEVFGYTYIGSANDTYMYQATGAGRADRIAVRENPTIPSGISGSGTVHHIAFRAENERQQLDMREKVIELGLSPTNVIDRFYFRSVYFRTPAGILFEIATDGPGFTADEREADLGMSLALPPFLEHYRSQIEADLPTLSTIRHES